MENKIAIRYNKKNVCRLPVIRENGNAKIDIIIGVNYIDAKQWHEIKKQKSIIYKIATGIIEEIKPVKAKVLIKKEETVDIIVAEKTLLDKITDLQVKIKADQKIVNDETATKEEIKKADNSITRLGKQLIAKQKELEKLSDQETEEVLVTKFSDFSVKEKESTILETFSIASLNAFADNEQDGGIRLKIEKRIDSIQNAKTDDTIAHPDSHLKG